MQRNQGSTLSFWWPTCFSEWSPFVYRVINKTKLSITNFQKQIPWNTNESRSLDKTICTYNTSWIFFVFFNYLFIHYSFCTVCINNLKVWGFLTQLCHNERNFLGNMKFKQSPNFVSEFTVWNFRYRFLVYHEIETFTKEVHLKFEDDIIFRFLYIILTIGLWYVSTISHNLQTAWKESSEKDQHRWKNLVTIISSWKHAHFSKNPFFLENCCILQDSFRGSHKKISQNS